MQHDHVLKKLKSGPSVLSKALYHWVTALPGGRWGSAGKIFAIMLICNMTMCEKVEFWPFDPTPGSGGGGGMAPGNIFATMLLLTWIPLMQHDHVLKKLKFNLLTLSPGSGVWVCEQNGCYLLAAFVIPFSLICNMSMLWKSWILNFWPNPLSPPRGSDPGLWSKIMLDMFNIQGQRVGGGGLHTFFPIIWYAVFGLGRGGVEVNNQNICYHVAAYLIPFKFGMQHDHVLKSWILTFWPHPLSPPRGSDPGLGSKIH